MPSSRDDKAGLRRGVARRGHIVGNRAGVVGAVLVLAAMVALLRLVAGPAPEAGMLPAAQAADGGSLPGSTRAGGAGLGVTGPGPMVSPAAEARAAQALEAAQRAAQEAAVRAAENPAAALPPGPARGSPAAVTGAPLARPDYVSEVEWQVLQVLAARSADPARELRRLVDKLRFSKQLEAWRATAAPLQRQALATQLLQDLPARVQAGDYARSDALALQQELLVTLEPDPAARAARAAAEAARLGGRLLQEQAP